LVKLLFIFKVASTPNLSRDQYTILHSTTFLHLITRRAILPLLENETRFLENVDTEVYIHSRVYTSTSNWQKIRPVGDLDRKGNSYLFQ